MPKLNIYISPLYIISAFFMIYFGAFDVFCYYLLALWLHEFGHYIVSKRLGYMLNTLSFLPQGARLQGDTNYKNDTHKIIVTLSGPIFNLICVLLIIAMWWIYPDTYSYTNIFMEANLYIAIFNLIPLFPFDGGQALLSAINKSSRRTVFVIMKILSVLISIVYMSLFIFSLFHTPNFTFLCMSIFMFISTIESYNANYVDGINKVNFRFENVVESKTYIVRCDINFINLTKFFSNNYFVIFQFVDDNYFVVDSKNQMEIIKDMENSKYFLK